MGLPWWLSLKDSVCNAGTTGDMGSIPGLGRSPAGGHGNPLQYSSLESPMDTGAWQATVHRITKSETWLKWCSIHTHTHTHTHLYSHNITLLIVQTARFRQEYWVIVRLRMKSSLEYGAETCCILFASLFLLCIIPILVYMLPKLPW